MAPQTDRIWLTTARDDLEGIEAVESDFLHSDGDGIRYGCPTSRITADAFAARDRPPQMAGANHA